MSAPDDAEDLRARMAANDRQMNECERQIAYHMGRIEAALDGLRTDPEIVALAGQIAAGRGVDVAVYMDELIGNRKAALRAQHPAPAPAEVPTEPAVKRFREMLG